MSSYKELYSKEKQMYFWKIESLKSDINNKKLDEKASFPYILITIALYIFFAEVMAYIPSEEEDNLWTYTTSVIGILMPILGTIYAYKKNGGENGKSFANKSFSISFVMGIRFLVYLIPIMIILIGYWEYRYGEQELISVTPFEVILHALWYGLLYYKIAKHISDVSKV